MDIFNKPAEENLVAMASKLKEQVARTYCVVFHLSGLGADYKNLDPSTLLNLIKEETADIDGGIYLCSDSDLFVILQTSKEAVVDNVITKVKFFYADDPLVCGVNDNNAQGFTTVFDIRKEYESFFLACNSKKVALKKAIELKKKQQQDKEVKKAVDHAWEGALQNRKKRGKRLCILIVEDQAFSRQLLTESLGKEHVTLAAKDAAEGISLYMMNAPDIVFLDIELPDHDGHYVLKNLLKKDPAAFVVMTTANNSSADVKKSISEGAKGYIVKPFTKGKIVQYIDLYLTKFKQDP